MIEIPGEPEQAPAGGEPAIQIIITAHPNTGVVDLKANHPNPWVLLGIIERAKSVLNNPTPPQQRNIVVPNPVMNGGRF